MTRVRRWGLAVAVAAAIAGPVAGGAMMAQSQVVVPPVGLSFELASVRAIRSQPKFTAADRALQAGLAKMMLSRQPDGELKMGATLHSLIQVAYDVTPFQVDGGPSWAQTDAFAVEARAAGAATPELVRAMMQSLLADKFQLALRRETRTMPVFELVPADGGLRIEPMKEGGCIDGKQIRWDLLDLDAPLFVCGGFRNRVLSQSPETRPFPRWPRVLRIEAGGASIATLIDVVSPEFDRPLVDRTGFSARFNLLLDFARPPAAGSEPTGPTILEALQDQLGLRLRATPAPVDVFVIEHAERPVAN